MLLAPLRVKRPSLLGLIAPTLVFLWLAYLFARNGQSSFVPAWLWLAFGLPVVRIARPLSMVFPPFRIIGKLFGLGTAALFIWAGLHH